MLQRNHVLVENTLDRGGSGFQSHIIRDYALLVFLMNSVYFAQSDLFCPDAVRSSFKVFVRCSGLSPRAMFEQPLDGGHLTGKYSFLSALFSWLCKSWKESP